MKPWFSHPKIWLWLVRLDSRLDDVRLAGTRNVAEAATLALTAIAAFFAGRCGIRWRVLVSIYLSADQQSSSKIVEVDVVAGERLF